VVAVGRPSFEAVLHRTGLVSSKMESQVSPNSSMDLLGRRDLLVMVAVIGGHKAMR
jgi:hypothetical protein